MLIPNILVTTHASISAMQRAMFTALLILTVGCRLFGPSTETTQPTAAEQQAKIKVEVDALSGRCKAGDDKACAQLFDNPYADMHNLLFQRYQAGTDHDGVITLVGRCCSGGSDSACVLQRQLQAGDDAKKRMEEHNANLGLVSRTEIAKVQPGWSLAQVVEALGQECALQTRNVYRDPSLKRDVDRASYHCVNSDGSGLYLVLLDGEVGEMVIVGPPPD